MKRNMWISVTGIDGCGKTTAVKYIMKKLPAKKFSFKSPYFKWVNEALQISGDNKHSKDVITDNLIFALNHRLENYLIKKWIKSNNFLVSQRSIIDFFVFRMGEGVNIKESMKLIDFNKDIVFPDVLVFLECDYKTGYKRIKNSLKKDKYETLQFLKRLEYSFKSFFKENYRILNKTKIIRIDGRKSINNVRKEINKKLLDKLKV